MSDIPSEYLKSPQLCAYKSTQKLRVRNSPEIPLPLAALVKLGAFRYETSVPKLCSEFPEFDSETQVRYPKSPQIYWSRSTQKIPIPKKSRNDLPVADRPTLIYRNMYVLRQSYELPEFKTKVQIEVLESPQIY